MRRMQALLLFLLLLVLSLYAADDFSFSADSMSTTVRQGEKRTLLSGNARIESGSLEIIAENLELYGPDFRFAVAETDVSISDQEQGFIIDAENLFYDREEGLARIQGNAEMTDTRNGVVVKGGLLENLEEEELTIIQGRVRIFKDEIVARSEYARYQRDTEILELSGMPHVFKGDDEYKAERIIINLKNDEITLKGRVSGEVISSEKPEEEGEAAAESEEPTENNEETQE